VKVRAQSAKPLHTMIARLCPKGELTIGEVQSFAGPNPFLPAPATICPVLCRMTMQPGTSARIRGTVSNLLGVALPEPATSPGSHAAEFAELIASAFTSLVRTELGLDLRARTIDEGGDRAVLVLEHAAIVPQMLTLAVAMEAAIQVMRSAKPQIPAELGLLRRILGSRRPNNESRMLIAVAQRRALTVDQIGANSAVWRFGMGRRSDIFWVTSSNGDGLIGYSVSLDKHYSKEMFVRLGMPTPKWRRLRDKADIGPAIDEVGWPCVVKPLDRGSGKGVYANIRDRVALNNAVAAAHKYSPHLMVEAHQPGQDYRLLVLDGRLAMAIRRDPPAIEGDGVSSIGELVARLNVERSGGPAHPTGLYPVPVDENLEMALTAQHLTIDAIVPEGARIVLRTNANHATGGTCTDVLATVDPTVARAAELLAEGFGLRAAGVDYMTPDISRSFSEVGGGFIEINATPGLEVLITSNLIPPETADAMLGSRPAHIPVTLVIAPLEASAQLCKELTAQSPSRTGISSSGFGSIGPYELPIAPQNPVECVLTLLRYPMLDQLLVIWTIEELLDWGLPVERIARAALVGVSLDQQWTELLRRHCDRIDTFATVKRALAALLARDRKRQPSAR
jgi:cyanophycin synthetase